MEGSESLQQHEKQLARWVREAVNNRSNSAGGDRETVNNESNIIFEDTSTVRNSWINV